MKRNIGKWIVPILTVIFVAVFPAIFLYGNNANEANLADVLPAMGMFSAIALAMFVLSVLVTRNTNKSAIITVLFMLVFENFAALEGILLMINSNLRYWHTTAIMLFILLHIGYLIHRFLPDDLAASISPVLCLVFGGLLLINGLTAIPGEINKWNARQLEAKTLQTEEPIIDSQAAAKEDLPNIYLLIFDEFAGFHQMEKYYNDDNAVLKDYLEENHFTISYDSHNESIITTTIVTNLVNLDYVVSNETSEAEKTVARENGALFSTLSDMGYQIRTITTNGRYGQTYEMDDFHSGNVSVTATGDDLNTILFKNTPLYPWCVHTENNELKIAGFLESEDCIPTVPTFTLAHMLITHVPFYFDEDGNMNPSKDWDDWRNNDIYLGIHKYNSKIIMSIVNNLVSNDPDSLILIMSDHGARASTDAEIFMEKFALEDINNIFNVFYYKGMDLTEYRDLSSVNTLRMLLNISLGTDYELVEVPVDDYQYK